MAWALQFNGVNSRASFPLWVASGDFSCSGVFTYKNQTCIVLAERYSTSDFIACIAGGEVRCRVNGNQRGLNGFVEGDVVSWTLSRTGTLITFNVNGSQTTFTESGDFRLNTFGVYSNDSLPFPGQLRGVTVLDNGVDARSYDVDQSNHTTGQPILTDTIGGNNATGVNFPTDGSAWIDLGGGGVNYDITLDQGSYTQTGNSINLKVDRSLQLETGSYSLTGQPVGIVYTPLSPSYDITLEQGVYSLTGEDLQISVGRALQLQTGNYEYNGDNLSIVVNRNLSLESGSYTYTGEDLSITKSNAITLETGAYTVTGSPVGINYSGFVSVRIDSYTVNYEIDSVSGSYQQDIHTATYQDDLININYRN